MAAAERLLEGLTQLGVGRDAAAGAEVGDMALAHRRDGLGHLHIDDGGLEACSKVGQVDGATGGVLGVDEGDDSRLEPRQREAVVVAVQHRAREVDGLRVARFGKAGDDGPAGITQAKGLGHLVEGLAHRVVECLAQDAIVAPVAHVHEHGVAARQQARHERRLEVGRLKEVGEEMPLEVVHAHEGLVGRPGKALGKCHAHDERAHETRALRDGNGGQVVRGQHGAQAERLARLLHGLQVDAHNGLGVLARGNLGHDAAEAGVEVNLSGNDVGDDLARAVDDGHGRLVAAALNRQNELASRLESLGLLGRALRIDGRPRAGARLGAGLDVGVGGGVFERKLRGHDARTYARSVVVGTNALLNITKTLVEALGGGVAHLNLERGGCGAEHLGVVGNAAHEARGDALASTLGGNGDVCNLQLAVHDGAARITHDGAAVMRHPPDVAGKRNVVVERALRPGRVVGIGKDGRLERRHGSDVVDAHGAQLQVDVAQGVVDAAHAHAFRLGHAQADALVFLGVGQARIDGQDKRGIPGLDGIETLRRQACAQKALATGVPGLLGGKAGKASLLVERAILGDAVTGKHDVAGIGTTSPQGHGVGDLHHRLAGKQAMCALVVDTIETGVDLLAHGIAHDAH